MTDHRLPRDSFLGHAGRLSLKPVELVTKAEDCVWQSSRDHAQNGLSVKRLSPTGTAEEDTHDPTLQDDPADAWQVSKQQEAWLLRNHPEARLGDLAPIHRLLSSANGPANGRRQKTDSECLVAAGEMMDFTEPSHPKPVSYLAKATGVGKNVIRIETVGRERWQCSLDENITISPMGISPTGSIDYSPAIGPIRTLKCVVDPKPYDPLRILLVQWDTETRLLVPEIGKAASNIETGLESVASTINPHCVVCITRHDTGGGNHRDVAFNPGNKAKQPQLAIVDEEGAWTAWDLPGLRTRTSRRLKPRLARHGSIEQEEDLKKSKPTLSSASEWHRIAWVGPPDEVMPGLDDSDYEDELGSAPPVHTAVSRSTSLLLCGRKLVRVFDLNTGGFLPSLTVLASDLTDQILEVRIHSHDTSLVFLATTRAVVVVRLTSTVGRDFTKPDKSWFILSLVPHFRSPLNDLTRLSVTAGPRGDGRKAFLVLLYSRGSQTMDLLCLTIEKEDPVHICWRRESLRCVFAVQSAWLQPVASEFTDKKSHGMYAQRIRTSRDRFYQLLQARADADVQQSLLMISADLIPQLKRCGFARMALPPPAVKETTKSGRRVATRFVVPDSEAQLLDAQDLSLEPQISELRNTRSWAPARFLGPMSSFVEGKESAIADDNTELNPFDLVHDEIEQAAAADSLPASTALELVRYFKTPHDLVVTGDDWNTEIELLKRVDSRLSTLSLQRWDCRLGNADSLSGLVGDLQSLFGVEDNAEETGAPFQSHEHQAALRKMACDLYLSSTGFYLQKEIRANREPDSQESALLHEAFGQDDIGLGSSQLHSEVRASQAEAGSSQIPTVATTVDTEDPAMKMIRSYTGSGRFMLKKETELGALWKTGADPHDYTFDLDKEKEVTEGMQRREKKLAKANRKRQRVGMLMDLQERGRQQSENLPATQPVPEPSFAQSSPVRQQSSQHALRGFSQGLPQMTMSQPITGSFAQRPKKKVKRKGGF